jgi:deoxyribose-phosphate aldolase
MTREQLIELITQEVVRALAEERATGTSPPAASAPGAGSPPPSAGAPSDAGAEKAERWDFGNGVTEYGDGLVDVCRDLGICRIGSSPGVTAAPRLASLIDHTILKPDATQGEIERLCAEANANGFASVCVQPWWVPLCADLLAGSTVKVCTVIGFPHGMNKPETKSFEARRAVLDGATELDMVINIGALKSKDLSAVERDIRAVVESGKPRATIKVILENAYLTDEEKAEGCALAKAVGADYVKTSTGFGPGGATVEDVALMRRVVGPDMGVKAAGGIRDAVAARKMIEAGATRIGASASLAIVQEGTSAAS